MTSTYLRITALAALGALAACMEAGTDTTASPTRTAAPERAPAGQLPEVLRLAGERQPVETLHRNLMAEGINAEIVAVGRDAGHRLVCSGGAEVLVIETDLSDTERRACSDLGMTWSVGSTESGYIAYADYHWSENLFRASSEF